MPKKRSRDQRYPCGGNNGNGKGWLNFSVVANETRIASKTVVDKKHHPVTIIHLIHTRVFEARSRINAQKSAEKKDKTKQRDSKPAFRNLRHSGRSHSD